MALVWRRHPERSEGSPNLMKALEENKPVDLVSLGETFAYTKLCSDSRR